MLEVADRGPACPPACASACSSASPAAAATPRRSGGSGLGLAIVQGGGRGPRRQRGAPRRRGRRRPLRRHPAGRLAGTAALRSRLPCWSNRGLAPEPRRSRPREVAAAPAPVARTGDRLHRPVRLAGRRLLRRRHRLHRQPRDQEQRGPQRRHPQQHDPHPGPAQQRGARHRHPQQHDPGRDIAINRSRRRTSTRTTLAKVPSATPADSATDASARCGRSRRRRVAE